VGIARLAIEYATQAEGAGARTVDGGHEAQRRRRIRRKTRERGLDLLLFLRDARLVLGREIHLAGRDLEVLRAVFLVGQREFDGAGIRAGLVDRDGIRARGQ
jgi:hypothetical protein